MTTMSNAEKLEFLDAYQRETGVNRVVADELAQWLRQRPEHPMHARFFGDDDAEAAWEMRVHRVRMFINSVRVVVRQVERNIPVVTVKPREVPAFVSPIESRDRGGGYLRYDPDNPVMRDELRRQGRQALRSWLARFGAVFDADELAQPLDQIASDSVPATAAAA